MTMKKYLYLFLTLSVMAVVAACTEEFELDEQPPAPQDAAFNFEPTAENDNIIRFTADKEFFLMRWDLGNGAAGEGTQITGTYPTAGTYTVTLTVFNGGGSATSTQEVIIEKTDPTLLDKPLYNKLTGGVDAVNGKTWVIDSANAGHFGVGPDPSQNGDFPEWYQAGPNEKTGGGMYDDRYTFYLADFGFEMETNGDVYINGSQGPNFPGSEDSGVGDLRAPYTPPAGLTWNIAEPADSYPVLTISNGGFIGYYAGGRSYQIISIEENELFLRFVDQANDGLAWYLRLIPEGYDSTDPGENPDPGFTASDLNGDSYKAWKLKESAGAFGVGPAPGSDAYYPNGTDISGDRPCLFNDLFIFRANGEFEYNALGDIYGEGYMGLSDGCQEESNLTGTAAEPWASGVHGYTFDPASGEDPARITVTGTGAFIALPKAYNGGEYSSAPPADNASVTYEVLSYTEENGEEELTISVDIGGGVFWSFVLVPAEYTEEAGGLSLNDLTGGNEKAWKLKPAAGAFGVGPSKGSDAYYPNGSDISGDRPCLFNDLFIFKTGGEFEYDAQSDIFGEGYMGLSDGCQPETNLDGTPAEPWGSNIHTFSFQSADGDQPATITVTGTGAFIALPKAYNGGEYASAPPSDNASVTYEVLNYVRGSEEELTITIDVSGDGSVYWNFTLIPAQ